MTDLVLITNIVAPYRLATFRELSGLLDLHVIFSAPTEANRDWSVTRDLPFPATVLPGRRALNRRREPLYLDPALFGVLRDLRPTAVLVGGFSVPAFYSAAYCRLNGAALILFSEGTSATESSLHPWQSRARRLLVRRASAAVGTSRQAVERFAELGMPPSSCFVSPYAIETSNRPIRKFGNGRPRLLTVGQLIPRKGNAELLSALARLKDVDYELTVAGDGPEMAHLKELVATNDLEDRVHFPGFVDQPELPDLYSQHDLFVFPTISDTFGVVTLEAMAAGLPVAVSTRAGSTSDFVEDDSSGWTFDPLDADGMAAALRAALQSRSRWPVMGRRNRALIEASSPRAAANSIAAAYEAAMSDS